MAAIRSRGPALAWGGGSPAERGTRPGEPVSQFGFGQRAVLPLPLGDRLPSRLELEPVRTCFAVGNALLPPSSAESVVFVSQDGGTSWTQTGTFADGGWLSSISCAS